MPIRTEQNRPGITEVIMDHPPVNALDVAGWFSLADQLIAAGANVVICGRNEPDREIAEVGPDGTSRTALFVAGDVRNADDVAAIVATTTDTFGRLDLLVNNAGGAPPSSAADASPRFIERVIALNLLAPFYCAQAATAAIPSGPP